LSCPLAFSPTIKSYRKFTNKLLAHEIATRSAGSVPLFAP
jgi:hypothetical protein